MEMLLNEIKSLIQRFRISNKLFFDDIEIADIQNAHEIEPGKIHSFLLNELYYYYYCSQPRSVDPRGMSAISKSDYIYHLQCANKSFHSGFRLEKFGWGDPFYFCFGTVPEKQPTFLQTRFYFNLKPEGGSILTQEITYLLNKYRIPFQFKVLADPNLFVRADSAVLYISKQYCDLIYFLLQSEIIPAVKDSLKVDNTKLALRLFDGISFAESPADGKSFGMDRMSLIADAILENALNDVPVAEWPGNILQFLKECNLNTKEIWRVPNTNYSYIFCN
jgi:hypothetical protein